MLDIEVDDMVAEAVSVIRLPETLQSGETPAPDAVHTNMRLKAAKPCGQNFCQASDAGGLTPAKDDNAAWRKLCRKECLVLVAYWYQSCSSE